MNSHFSSLAFVAATTLILMSAVTVDQNLFASSGGKALSAVSRRTGVMSGSVTLQPMEESTIADAREVQNKTASLKW